MLVHESGAVELVGSMRVTPRITLPDGSTLPAGDRDVRRRSDGGRR